MRYNRQGHYLFEGVNHSIFDIDSAARNDNLLIYIALYMQYLSFDCMEIASPTANDRC